MRAAISSRTLINIYSSIGHCEILLIVNYVPLCVYNVNAQVLNGSGCGGLNPPPEFHTAFYNCACESTRPKDKGYRF